jgi:hypothetical protein
MIARLLPILFVLSCRPPRPIDFAVRPNAEPAGTFAVEGYLGGEQGPGELSVVLYMNDTGTFNKSGSVHRLHSSDGRFRIAGVPCPRRQELQISIHTDDGRGGTIRSTPRGAYVSLTPNPGDRLVNVEVDLVRGWSFRGTVRDANTGAPIEGVAISAVYARFGGRNETYGMAAPFTLSDAGGHWTLYGVEAKHLRYRERPELSFQRDGYIFSTARTTPGAVLEMALTPQ